MTSPHDPDSFRTRATSSAGPPRPAEPEESEATSGPDTVDHARVERMSIRGYEIVGALGRGGMGVVYKAIQLGLRRTVALKMILAGGHAGEAELARFKAEAEALARLQHPNIVTIHEIGDHDGLPFLALEYCAGGSLAGRLGGRPMPPAEAAALVEALARAIAVAHKAAVVHRDLKPANVLLTPDGTPKVTDFGLAKRLNEASMTASGAVMGTPSYMSPEQAQGKKEVGPLTDVYALGAILYECVSGRPPFVSETAVATIAQVIADEPPPLSRTAPAAPRDLRTICHKCLEKDPARRYPGAGELADDLARFRAGEPIKARPVGWLGRAWRRVKRRPGQVGLAATATGLLAVVVVLAARPGRSEPGPAPVATDPAPPAEDEVLKVVAELDRTEPGWRIDQLEARRQTVPAHRNSAPRAAAVFRDLPRDWEQRQARLGVDLTTLPPGAALSAAQRDGVENLLRAADRQLTVARMLIDFPEGRHPITHSRDGLGTMVTHAQSLRPVAGLLWYDALRRARAGDADGALTSCQAAINAGRSLLDEPTSVSQLVRMACVNGSVQRAEDALALGAATEGRLRALQELLGREAGAPVLLIVARSARAEIHEIAKAITSGDVDFAKGAELSGESADFIEAQKKIPRGQAARRLHAWSLRHTTRLVAIARLPDHEQPAAVREWERAFATAPQGVTQLLVAPPRVVGGCLRHRALVRGAAAALAAERYRLKHGRWPAKLDELRPDFLTAVPADPYDGKPLRYRRLADGVVIYALGPDVKDDGGTIDRPIRERAGSDVGFRLWDAAARKRQAGVQKAPGGDK